MKKYIPLKNGRPAGWEVLEADEAPEGMVEFQDRPFDHDLYELSGQISLNDEGIAMPDIRPRPKSAIIAVLIRRIKTEAERRIIAIMPEFQQRNAALYDEDRRRFADQLVEIRRLRAKSNEIEASLPGKTPQQLIDMTIAHDALWAASGVNHGDDA